jgi:ABC-type transporter MlaC component
MSASAVFADAGKPTVQNLVRIFAAWNGSPKDSKTFSEAARYIDYERALGQGEWAKLSGAQKKRFVDALRTVVEQRYYPRWHRLFAKGVMTYGQESTVGGDTVLKTSLKINQKSQDLSWCMDKKGGDLRVVSLGVNDKDLLNKLHVRVLKKLKATDFDGLVAWLKNKAPHEADESDKDSTDSATASKKG